MSERPTTCLYCDHTDPDCGFCDMGVPLDTQEDWDASWGQIRSKVGKRMPNVRVTTKMDQVVVGVLGVLFGLGLAGIALGTHDGDWIRVFFNLIHIVFIGLLAAIWVGDPVARNRKRSTNLTSFAETDPETHDQ